MPTPYESAQLNLRLFELRREPVFREAREWFLWEFNPDSLADIIATMNTERNTAFRMVMSYWEMAASMVTSGAIDAESFLAAHGEIFGTFSKIQPFLAEMRAASNEPELGKHLEAVVMAAPDAAAILKRRREGIRAATQARKESRGKAACASGGA